MSDSFRLVCETFRDSKVLVLGSSPRLNIPPDYTDEWKLICINASGRAALSNQLKRPDLTVFAISALIKPKPQFDEVREYVGGLSSRHVFLRFLGGGFLKRAIRTRRARKVLDTLGYQFDGLYGLPSAEWKSVVLEVMGEENYPLAKNISTGAFCVMLAIYSGAEKVMTAGIDPNTEGHSYSKTDFKREHKNSDVRVLDFLQERYGVEVF